jgi:hypothetical protein
MQYRDDPTTGAGLMKLTLSVPKDDLVVSKDLINKALEYL